MKKTNQLIPVNNISPGNKRKKSMRGGLVIPDCIYLILTLGLVIIFPFMWITDSSAQAASVPTDAVTLENETETFLYTPANPDPAGITYLFTADLLLISDSEVDEISLPNPAAYTGKNLFLTNRLGAFDSTLTTYDPPDITFSNEPSGVAVNPNNDFLYFTDNNVKKIFELDPGSDGDYNTGDDGLGIYDATPIGSLDPSGIAYDNTRGHLFVVDDTGEEVYDIDLGTNDILDQSDTVTHFDVTSLGIRNPEGVEYNPDNCTLFILSSRKFDHLIAETTIDGHLLRYLDIASIDGGEHATNPAGLAYAPASGSSSDNNLYIVARGLDNNTHPLENDGKMFEVSFDNNAPPFVDAGQNDWTFLPNSVPLDGTVTDGCSPDLVGVPTTWSVTSGPGTVIFGDHNAIDTTASFSTNGEYILKLQADDGGAHIVSDEVTITVIPPGNQPPTATISAPTDGATFDQGVSITFTGSASDSEDGDVTTSLEWVSDLDGNIGTGATFQSSDLSIGLHTITATATDSGELTGSAQVTIRVYAANTPPTATISAPTDSATFDQGVSITFTGSASDSEDGDVTASLQWVSDLDGPIGTGATFQRSDLSIGLHTITATATDSGELTGSDQITLSVNAANTPPTATISAPTDGATFDQGVSITFTGSASDSEDGDVTASLQWVSDLDGPIGTGATFQLSDLSAGLHTITTTATDNSELTGSAQINITVNAANTPPTATISTPTDGALFDQGVSITFTGSASDSEDGDVTASLKWVSGLDGLIGTGATFQLSDLSIGLHTITATAADNSDLSAFDEIAITVYPIPLHTIWIPIVLKISTVP